MKDLKSYFGFKLKDDRLADYFLILKDHFEHYFTKNNSRDSAKSQYFEGNYGFIPNPESLPKNLKLGSKTKISYSELKPIPINLSEEGFVIEKEWTETD